MRTQDKLSSSFKTTRRLVHRFAVGLSNEDSLAVPVFNCNNFNWVVGHILVSRERVLGLLNQQGVFSQEEKALYETGSELVNEETAVPLYRLLAALDASQAAIERGLQGASAADLEAPHGEAQKQTILERLQGLHWHETYHLGQLEILRQVSAARDAFP